jgi:hypothetical protein
LAYIFPPFPIAHVSFGLSEAFAQLFTKHLWRLIDRYRASLHTWMSSELNNPIVRFDCLPLIQIWGFSFFSCIDHLLVPLCRMKLLIAITNWPWLVTLATHTAFFYLSNFPVPNWYRYTFSLLLTCWGNSKSGYGMHVLKESSLEFWPAWFSLLLLLLGR